MLDHAITVRDLLTVAGLAIVVLIACLFALAAFAYWREWLDLIRHRYIRSGETVYLFDQTGNHTANTLGGSSRVTVEGWGKYAAVRLGDGPGYIRRDGIRKDADGRWVYRYD